MDTLPYELSLQIWLETDYESLKELCAIARNSEKPGLQVQKELCDDPQSWITRAHDKLGINPRDFWHRWKIEEALELPGETEGRRAQMRYVELVSRKGVVSDSIYFLESWEVARRAFLEGKEELFNQYIEQVKEIPGWDDIRAQMFKSDPLIIRIIDTPLGRRIWSKIWDRPYLEGTISLIGTLVATGNLEGFKRELDKVLPVTTNRASYLHYLLTSNDLTLIKEQINKYPDILVTGLKEQDFSRFSDPKILEYLMERLDVNHYIGINARVIPRSFLWGHEQIVDLLIETFNIPLNSLLPCTDDVIMSTLFLWIDAIKGSYGLQTSQWLLDHNCDIRTLRTELQMSIFSSKAVRAFFWGSR